MHRVPYRTFLKWNAAGGIIFSTVVVLLGYQFASSLSTLEKYLRYWAIFFLAIAVAVILYLKRKLEQFIEEPE
jgi:membrane protein DedA with SNARE-associated domain